MAWFFLPRLTVAFLPNNCLFLAAFKMSSRCIYMPKKVAKSGQKRPEDLRNPSFQVEESPRDALRTLWLLAGSWIRTVHATFDTVFDFLPDFSVWKRFGMVILSSWLRNCGKTNCEPFQIVSGRVEYNVLVGLKSDPWKRDGTVAADLQYATPPILQHSVRSFILATCVF